MFTIVTRPVLRATSAPNLINSASTPQDGADWPNGVMWVQESCPDGAMQPYCADPDPADAPALGPGLAYFRPHGYRVRDECSTMSGAVEVPTEVEARLRRKADAIESFMAARELWTGAMTTADPSTDQQGNVLVNAHLAAADAETVVTTAATVAGKLGELEAAALAVTKGSQIALHLPPAYVLELGNLLRRVGNRMYTPLDSLVIADAGYPGTGPDGTGTTWAYATGLVYYESSPLEVLADMGSTLDRPTNRYEMWAERVFAATFDPCVHLAADLAAAG